MESSSGKVKLNNKNSFKNLGAKYALFQKPAPLGTRMGVVKAHKIG